ELGRLVVRSERSRHLVLHRWNGLQEHRNRGGVVLGHVRERAPRHDRRELASVRALAGLNGRDNLGHRPVADAGFAVGRQVRAVEHAEPGNLKAHFRAAKIARHVGLAEEIARGMAVRAASKRHQVLPAFDLRLLGRTRGYEPKSKAKSNRRADGADHSQASYCPHIVPPVLTNLLHRLSTLTGYRDKPLAARSSR